MVTKKFLKVQIVTVDIKYKKKSHFLVENILREYNTIV